MAGATDDEAAAMKTLWHNPTFTQVAAVLASSTSPLGVAAAPVMLFQFSFVCYSWKPGLKLGSHEPNKL